MKLLDRYIFFEWLKVFIIAMSVTLGILLMDNMYNKLSGFIAYGASISEIAYFYALLAPTFVPVVLPVSLLLSLIFTVGNFHKNNEITAMRAAGQNIFRITRSLWFGGFMLAIMLFCLNAYVVPHAVERSRRIQDAIELSYQKSVQANLSEIGKINSLSFHNNPDNRIWMANSFSRLTNKATGIFVSTVDENSQEISKVMAREAVYDEVDKHWVFYDGQELFFNPQTGRAVRSLPFEKKSFPNFTEKPDIMLLTMKRTKDLSLFELSELIKAAQSSDETKESDKLREYKVKYTNIWLSALICIIVVAIAIPFSVAGVRTNPMVGVSKTVAMFFIFYIADNIFTAIGTRGILPPVAAVLVPVVLMLAFSLNLYRKVV